MQNMIVYFSMYQLIIFISMDRELRKMYFSYFKNYRIRKMYEYRLTYNFNMTNSQWKSCDEMPITLILGE